MSSVPRAGANAEVGWYAAESREPMFVFSTSVTKLSSAQRDRETTGAVGSVESTDIFVPPTTLSTCPPPPPLALIVKFGYVPVIVMFVPAVRATT